MLLPRVSVEACNSEGHDTVHVCCDPDYDTVRVCCDPGHGSGNWFLPACRR